MHLPSGWRTACTKKITITKNSQECLEGADIMVEATRLMEPQPLLRTAWVRPGNFVVPYGTICANEITLTDVMDKDRRRRLGQCKEGGKLGQSRPHVRAGKLTKETLYAELGEIVAGKKPGAKTIRKGSFSGTADFPPTISRWVSCIMKKHWLWASVRSFSTVNGHKNLIS